MGHYDNCRPEDSLIDIVPEDERYCLNCGNYATCPDPEKCASEGIGWIPDEIERKL